MKVLFLNTDLGYGGAEKIMAWLANGWADSGLEVVFLTYRNNKQSYQILSPTVKHVHIPMESKGGSIWGFLQCVKRLHRYIKSEHYDIAVAFLSPSQIRLVQACKHTKTKVLLSQRSDPYFKNRMKGLRKIFSKKMGKLFLQGDAYVFQTPQARDYYPERIRKKSIVLPNPISPLIRTEERIPDKRIVNVARLDITQKRQDIIIEAFNKISAKYPDYILEFYGSGGDEQTLKDMSCTNRRIRFMGVSRNIVEAIQNAAMFILASDFEGIPNALLEAMSLGLPCISTTCSPGGAELLIKDSSIGQLVDCGDVQALADAMERFILTPQFAEDCGRNAMYVNEAFSESKILSEWTDFLDKI